MFPTRCTGVEYFLLKVIGNLSDMDLIINTRDYPQSSEYYGNAMPIFSFSKVRSFVIYSEILVTNIFVHLSYICLIL